MAMSGSLADQASGNLVMGARSASTMATAGATGNVSDAIAKGDGLQRAWGKDIEGLVNSTSLTKQQQEQIDAKKKKISELRNVL